MDLDIREYAFKILETAKENLLRDGCLVPVAFVITPQTILHIPISFEGQEEKEREYRKVVEVAGENEALAVVTLNDAYYGNKGTATEEWLESYYPGKLADERAPECILMTVSGPGIRTWTLILPYQRSQEGIVFGKVEEEGGGKLSLLAGWASDSSNSS